MSALTSSPSPAASPRAPLAAHYTRPTQRRPSSSPRISPYPSTSSRPHAPATSTQKKPAPEQSSSPRSFRTPANKPQTSDAGTQYTPDGLPPTATRVAGSKRKDTSPSSPMNTATTPYQPVPDHPLLQEPDPRITPAGQAVDSTPLPLESSAIAQANAAVAAQGDASHPPPASKKPRTSVDDHVKIMPLQYELCNPKDLGFLISNMLMELIRLNDQIPLNGRLTRFHSRAPPGISCHDYLQRLIQHATLSPPILLSMVYYIDRLCAMYPAFNVSSLTVHRFLITAATVAAKGLSDSFWTNPTYARIGGISTSELATLEMEFLQKVQWRIVPKPEVLVDYYVSLVQRSEGYRLDIQPDQDVTSPSDGAFSPFDSDGMVTDPP